MKQAYHVPVLLNEAIDGLKIIPDGTYVDCTFGGGGHSRKILERLGINGRLLVFDQDDDAARNVPDDKRITFVPQNFIHLKRFLRLYKIQKVNGILADLGVSSHQFDEPQRGFSTRFDAALDMRMNQADKITAADILNSYPEEKLHRLFEQYGEVTNAKTLAKTIVEARKEKRIKTSNELKNAVYSIVKGNPEKYFAQVYQALRIEVNDELNALKELLTQSVDVLDEGGRIAVITFHSLEDRIVKNFFKAGNFDGVDEQDLFGNKKNNHLKVITKKPVTPSSSELKKNPRSRSSKLRVAEKVKVSN